jgi:Protein of unknown function (DUF2829)
VAHFGHALEVLKEYRAVARLSWSSDGQLIYLVGDGRYLPTTPVGVKIAAREEDERVPYAPYIAVMTTRGDVEPWVASHSDLLATDWVIPPETIYG